MIFIRSGLIKLKRVSPAVEMQCYKATGIETKSLDQTLIGNRTFSVMGKMRLT